VALAQTVGNLYADVEEVIELDKLPFQKRSVVQEFTQLEVMLALRVLIKKGIITADEIDQEHRNYINETRALFEDIDDGGLG